MAIARSFDAVVSGVSGHLVRVEHESNRCWDSRVDPCAYVVGCEHTLEAHRCTSGDQCR